MGVVRWEGLGTQSIEKWVNLKCCSLRLEERLTVAMSEGRGGEKDLGELPDWTGQKQMGKWSQEKGMVCRKHWRPSCAWRLCLGHFAREVVFFCGLRNLDVG